MGRRDEGMAGQHETRDGVASLVEDLNPAAVCGDAHGTRSTRRCRIDEPEVPVGEDPEVRDGVRACIDGEERVTVVGERYRPLRSEPGAGAVAAGAEATDGRQAAAAATQNASTALPPPDDVWLLSV